MYIYIHICIYIYIYIHICIYCYKCVRSVFPQSVNSESMNSKKQIHNFLIDRL